MTVAPCSPKPKLTKTHKQPAREACSRPERLSTRRQPTFVERLQRGDVQAFQELVQRHQASMIKTARHYVADQAAAEEVVQDTWMGVLRGLPRFEQRSSLKTWIFRILLNRARTRGRRDARTVSFSHISDQPEVLESIIEDKHCGQTIWSAPAHSGPDHSLRRKQARSALHRALDGLPENQRTVVEMRDIEGADFREVCDALKITSANQRVLLHRGRARLRDNLAQDWSARL
jgi:RNA polymerase sigma-70 factor (ECF subfamily)